MRSTFAQEKPPEEDPIGETLVVVLVRPGDAAATAERAADFLRDFESLLRTKIACVRGRDVSVLLTNQVDGLRAKVRRLGADLVFAPASVYAASLRDPKPDVSEPVEGENGGGENRDGETGRGTGEGQSGGEAPTKEIERLHVKAFGEIRRFGAEAARYCIAVPKDSEVQRLGDLEGKELSTVATISEPWLRHAVFAPTEGPGSLFRLRVAENLSDDVFDLLEVGGDEAPDGILLDLETRDLLEADRFVWPELRVVWTSGPMPQDLLLSVGESWTDEFSARLRAEFASLLGSEVGEDLKSQMRADALVDVDRARLQAALERFDASRKGERAREDGDDRDG